MRASLAIALVAAVLGAAAPAHAAGPQKGRYECFFPNGFFTADLYILSSKKYRVEKERGRYKVRGKRLRIQSGPHKGKWKRVTWSKRPDLYGKRRTKILFHPKRRGSSLLECTWLL